MIFTIRWTLKILIISIEDGLSEHDWDGFKKMTDVMGDTIQIVGDDIFVTNPKILKERIETVAMNVGQIKTGSVARLERVEKYNQFLRIQEELGVKKKMTPL